MRYCPYCHSIYTAAVAFCGIDGRRLVESDQDPLVDFSVDRYRVVERLGMGTTGVVYKVVHAALGRVHAMKVLYGDLGANKKIVHRFRREARAMASIHHPNVVDVSDFGTSENGLAFLVMEYLSGVTLDQLIATDAPMRPARVAAIGAQIAAGLAEAHRHDFIHRDVKPSNMMMTRTESGIERLKILDFGVVGFPTSAATTQITGENTLVGTPIYMAPEQARKPSSVTAAADVYALGVLLYEMLTGVPPFEADRAIDLYIKHTLEVPAPLPPSSGLETLLPWMLEKLPERRPPSAALVRDELVRITGSGPSRFDRPILRGSAGPAPTRTA